MKFRQIRVTATGQWVAFLFTSELDPITIRPESHVASVAAGLGVDASTLEAIDTDADARTGTLLEFPVVSVTPTRKEELVAIGKDNWTDAQQKELIEILAE
jgi:hypothetical protein